MSSDEPGEPEQSDPFFTLPKKGCKSSEWNALIGRQGREENYVDGYIEAALELVNAVIERRLYIKRDTLVLPILYNARHAVELTLKFLIRRLTENGVLTTQHRHNHDISSHMRYLTNAALPDEALRTYLARLHPFVLSLSNIDADGQELRYYHNRSGERSLGDHSLVNLDVIRSSLQNLFEIIHDVKIRTFDFCEEQAWGTNTSRLSRKDLLEIAKLLPDRAEWKDATFSNVASYIKARYYLSKRQFSIALDAIQKNRLMMAQIGLESPLIHLNREKVIFLTECWLKLHPPREGACKDVKEPFVSADTLWKMINERQSRYSIYRTALERLSAEEIAEAEALFYLARDGVFPERYENLVKATEAEHRVANDPQEALSHILEKTNFLAEFAKGVMLVGCLGLAKELEGFVSGPGYQENCSAKP